MDHNSIIDKETFEVYENAEDYEKAFICDKPIAKAIASLNKKGYKTIASCSSHYYTNFVTNKAVMYVLFDNIYKFENVPEDFIVDESNGRTSINYVINRYKNENNNLVLKSIEEFTTEVEYVSQELTNWVDKLPNIRKE